MKILLDQPTILRRLDEMGREISAYYRGDGITAMVILNGAMFFAGDLLRRVELPLYVDSVRVSSYADNRSTGTLQFHSPPKMPVRGRRILLLDDILDTGVTLNRLRDHLLTAGAVEVKCAVLLDKTTRRAPGGLPAADWCGFRIPDVYVVGYGLDADELHRNHPFIGVLE